MIENKEIKNALKLLKNNKLVNRDLGRTLIRSFDVTALHNEVREDLGCDFCLDFSNSKGLYNYNGIIKKDTAQNVNKVIMEVLDAERQKKMSFVPIGKHAIAIIDVASWIFNFIQNNISKSIELLLDKNQFTQQYEVFIKEVILWEDITAKIELLENINVFIIAQDGSRESLRAAKKKLREMTVSNSSMFLQIEKITNDPITFFILPDQKLEKWFCLQKVTLNLMFE